MAASQGCWEQSVWSHTGEFAGHLRCGMSHSDVEQVASTYKGLRLEITEPSRLVFSKNDTTIEAEFESNALRRVKVTWIDTIMHVKSLPTRDLCELPVSRSQP
jgi:hypothetical protein